MPGNTVKINNADSMEWYIGDSKMDSLILWLNENGEKCKPKKPDTKMSALDKWLQDLTFPCKIGEFIQEKSGHGNGSEVMRRFCFYTEEHEYSITAIDRKKDGGYLGCTARTRKMRAGESWLRGNDLPDGSFNKNTWNIILRAIVRYELVALSKYTTPRGVPEEVEN